MAGQEQKRDESYPSRIHWARGDHLARCDESQRAMRAPGTGLTSEASMTRRAFATASGLLVTLLFSAPAHAYRPFDGTDADVAETGDFELELGPAHWYSSAGSHYLL